MKKKTLLIVLLCAAVLALAVGAYFALSDSDSAVMSINGKIISQSEFETYRAAMRQTGSEASDAELLDRLAETQVLFDEAAKRGYTATDKEIDEAIAFTRGILAQDDNGKARSFVESYIKELGISEDEYWERIRPSYEKSLTIGKLQDELKSELAKANGTGTVSTEEFEEYYREFTQELVDKADIEIMKK